MMKIRLLELSAISECVLETKLWKFSHSRLMENLTDFFFSHEAATCIDSLAHTQRNLFYTHTPSLRWLQLRFIYKRSHTEPPPPTHTRAFPSYYKIQQLILSTMRGCKSMRHDGVFYHHGIVVLYMYLVSNTCGFSWQPHTHTQTRFSFGFFFYAFYDLG